MAKFNAKKVKIDLKLAAQRCKMTAAKRGNLQAVARKEIARLLAEGKEESARVKVETVIREDSMLEVLEILEMLCNTLLARFGVIETMKYIHDSIMEPVCTILFAAPRMPLEVKEIHSLHSELYIKYGGEIGRQAMENENGCVNAKVAKRLDDKPPSKKLVNAYLQSIADSHSVAWTAPCDTPPPEPVIGDVVKPQAKPLLPLPTHSLPSPPAGVDTSSSTFQSFLTQQAKTYQEKKVNEPAFPPPMEDEPVFNFPTIPTTKTPPKTAPAPPPESDSDDDFDDLAARFKKLNK